MEVDTLLSGSRWQIIQILARKATSPMELSEQIGTTLANVSAQLRLLEAANILTKTRTKSAQAGKPRVLYSLKKNQAFIARLSSPQATKRLQKLQPLDALMLAILQLDIPDRKHLYNYLLKYGRQLEKRQVGLSQDGFITTIGVVGEHSLPNVEDKPYKIVVRRVSTLEQFQIKAGEEQ